MLNEIKEGDRLNGLFLFKKFEVKQARNGNSYLDAIISDKSGEVSAKMWDLTRLEQNSLNAGSFAYIEGKVEVYNKSFQVILSSAKPTEPTDEELSLLVETAPYPPNKMYEKIMQLIEQIENEDIRTITVTLFQKEQEKLLYYPAAKNFHHAMRGGLLYHVYSMFRCALPLLDIYSFLNKDLVYAGIALHDLGKIDEMASDSNGIVSDYTLEGKLIGHITTTICDIETVSKQIDADHEITVLLQHMILAHHYHPEFGSPKPPMIPEAELLHYLDVLDSRMNQMQKTVEATDEKSFAERVWILDNRTIYHHSLNNNKENTNQ